MKPRLVSFSHSASKFHHKDNGLRLRWENTRLKSRTSVWAHMQREGADLDCSEARELRVKDRKDQSHWTWSQCSLRKAFCSPKHVYGHVFCLLLTLGVPARVLDFQISIIVRMVTSSALVTDSDLSTDLESFKNYFSFSKEWTFFSWW